MKEQKERKVRKEENRGELRINVHNDAEMVGLGLRPKPLTPRDPSIWSKTEQEKYELKLMKCTGTISTGWAAPLYSVNFPGKLIVYLKGFPKVRKEEFLNNQPHSVMSHKCKQSDIADILARYKKNGLTILKYAWNGRTYSADSLPVRLNRGGRVTA